MNEEKKRKRLREAEFRVWVEEPDPEPLPVCPSIWNGEWNHAEGARPSCFLTEGHEGDHHDTRKPGGGEGWIEYFWTEDPAEARREVRGL